MSRKCQQQPSAAIARHNCELIHILYSAAPMCGGEGYGGAKKGKKRKGKKEREEKKGKKRKGPSEDERVAHNVIVLPVV